MHNNFSKQHLLQIFGLMTQQNGGGQKCVRAKQKPKSESQSQYKPHDYDSRRFVLCNLNGQDYK